MPIQLVFHNAFSNRDYFELKDGYRPWNAFIVLSEGSFSYSVNGMKYIINKNEIAYFPQNISFQRDIIKPITLHQFGFLTDKDDLYLTKMSAGKLDVPA